MLNLKKLKEDNLLLQTILVVTLLAFCHFIQYSRSGVIQPLIKAICACGYVLCALIFGRKCWNIYIFLWAIAIMYWNRFYNFSSFVMVLFAASLNKKTKFLYIIIYSVCVCVCLFLYKDSWTHMAIHAIGCWFFYIGYNVISENKPQQKLELTIDEENIIKQLAGGKDLKQIEGYCQNTVFSKLKDARVRNNLERNCQLVEIYAATMK